MLVAALAVVELQLAQVRVHCELEAWGGARLTCGARLLPAGRLGAGWGKRWWCGARSEAVVNGRRQASSLGWGIVLWLTASGCWSECRPRWVWRKALPCPQEWKMRLRAAATGEGWVRWEDRALYLNMPQWAVIMSLWLVQKGSGSSARQHAMLTRARLLNQVSFNRRSLYLEFWMHAAAWGCAAAGIRRTRAT